MKPEIVFLDEYSVGGADLSAIRELGKYTGYEITGPEEIIERSNDAEIIIVNKTEITDEVISALPRLRLICVSATGMNNVDLDAAEKAGIIVRNAVDYSTHSVAEQTFAGVLALYKQLSYLDRFVKSGEYTDSPKLFNFGRPTRELYGKRWGIIGLGNIGRQVARLAAAFGCDVSYYSTSGKNTNKDYTRLTLDELLSGSDIVSLHAPLSRQTYHLLDYERLSMMKPDAIVVNVARGTLIDEEGLARALNENLIAGAAIDVYSEEPMSADNPLNKVEDKYKLVLTPHSAWHTREALEVLIRKVAENIRQYINGADSI